MWRGKRWFREAIQVWRLSTQCETSGPGVKWIRVRHTGASGWRMSLDLEVVGALFWRQLRLGSMPEAEPDQPSSAALSATTLHGADYFCISTSRYDHSGSELRSRPVNTASAWRRPATRCMLDGDGCCQRRLSITHIQPVHVYSALPPHQSLPYQL